ncbi:hypothetical protein J2W21_003388 [Sinomonas atrocyanea]|nr:hypothetical protein [Sinomonas atrocyanea]
MLLHPVSSTSAAPTAASRARSRWFRAMGGPFQRLRSPSGNDEGADRVLR